MKRRFRNRTERASEAQAKLTGALWKVRELTLDRKSYDLCFPNGEFDLRLYCAAHGFTWRMENRELVITYPVPLGRKKGIDAG